MRKEYEITDYSEYKYFKKRKQLDEYPYSTDWNETKGGYKEFKYNLLRYYLYLYGRKIK